MLRWLLAAFHHTALAPRWAAISRVQTALVLVLLFAATAMARGYGSP